MKTFEEYQQYLLDHLAAVEPDTGSAEHPVWWGVRRRVMRMYKRPGYVTAADPRYDVTMADGVIYHNVDFDEMQALCAKDPQAHFFIAR